MAQIIDRYLQAVRFWLPKGQQDDIAAELAEDLQSKIEEREAALGHKLDDAGIAAILKQSGRPMLVANRFLPQRSLIGPVLFPVYVFVLKMVALCYLLPWLLVLMGIAVWNESAGYVFRGLGTFWTVAFTSCGVVTIVFAVLERVPREEFLDNWDPRKLPTLRVGDPWQIKRSESIAEVVAGLAVIAFLIKGLWLETVMKPAGFHVVFAPAGKYFYWAFVLLMVASVDLAVVNLIRPYWTRTRAIIRLGLDCAGSVLFCWMVKAHVLTAVVWPNVPVARTAEIVAAINTYTARFFPLIVTASVVIVVLTNASRLMRGRLSRRTQLGGRAYSL